MNDQNKRLSVPVKMLLIVAVYVIFYALTSCGAKKKTVEKYEYSTEIATVKRVNELTEKSVVKESLTAQKKESTKENENEDFQAEIEDPSKDFELKKETKDGTTTWTGKNIKNLSNQSGKSKESSKDSIGQKVSKADKSKNAKESEASGSEKASGSERNVGVEKTGFELPWWIWLILLVVIAIYIVYSYLKRTIDPFNIF